MNKQGFILKIIFFFVLFALFANAQDLRLVSTNLYDFSAAGKVYHVHGEVSKIYPQSIGISIVSGFGFHVVKTPPIPPSMMTAEDQMNALAAFRMGYNDDGSPRLVSQGQYFAMSPEFRQYFEPATEYTTIFLLNPPPAKVGQTVDAVAVPTANKGFYDCGKPFTGDTNQFDTIYRVLNDRIVKISVTNSIATVTITNQMH